MGRYDRKPNAHSGSSIDQDYTILLDPHLALLDIFLHIGRRVTAVGALQKWF